MVQIDFRTQGIIASESMWRFVERKAAAALARLGDDLQAVTLRFRDINGPRGGNDKQCVLAISSARVGQVVVHATEADFYSAVERALERAKRALANATGKKRRSAPRPHRSESMDSASWNGS